MTMNPRQREHDRIQRATGTASDRQPLLDAIRRARGDIARDGLHGYTETHADDLALLIEAAVQSLTQADDVRRMVGETFDRTFGR